MLLGYLYHPISSRISSPSVMGLFCQSYISFCNHAMVISPYWLKGKILTRNPWFSAWKILLWNQPNDILWMVAKSCSCTTAAGWLKAYVMGHTTFQLVQDFFYPLLSQPKKDRCHQVKLCQAASVEHQWPQWLRLWFFVTTQRMGGTNKYCIIYFTSALICCLYSFNCLLFWPFGKINGLVSGKISTGNHGFSSEIYRDFL